MPLFCYQCKQCDLIVEKFLHRRDDIIDIVCDKCSGIEFDRIIGTIHNRTWLNAKDTLHQRILPDARRMQEEVANGSDSGFLDIAGD